MIRKFAVACGKYVFIAWALAATVVAIMFAFAVIGSIFTNSPIDWK